LGQTCKCKSQGAESYLSVDYGIAPYYYDENGNINSKYDYNDTGKDLLQYCTVHCKVYNMTKNLLFKTCTAGDRHYQMKRAMNHCVKKWKMTLKSLRILKLQTWPISSQMTLSFYSTIPMDNCVEILWLNQACFS